MKLKPDFTDLLLDEALVGKEKGGLWMNWKGRKGKGPAGSALVLNVIMKPRINRAKLALF